MFNFRILFQINFAISLWKLNFILRFYILTISFQKIFVVNLAISGKIVEDFCFLFYQIYFVVYFKIFTLKKRTD